MLSEVAVPCLSGKHLRIHALKIIDTKQLSLLGRDDSGGSEWIGMLVL